MTGRHSHPHTTRQSRLLRRAGALALLAAVVAGPPLLLVSLVGSPADPPASLRSPGALTQALDDRAVLWLLGTVGWLLWAHLLLALAAELARQTRGSAVRVPLPGLLFGANAALASHLIATLLLSGPAASHGALTPAVARVTVSAVAAAPIATMTPDAVPTPAGDQTSSTAAAAGSPATTAATPSPNLIQCRVLPPQGRDHDTLWDIAERHLGDGTRWRDIYALNEGRLMPDGRRLTRASLIHPGWILHLPPDAIALAIDYVPPPTAEPPRSDAAASPLTARAPHHSQSLDGTDAATPTATPIPAQPTTQTLEQPAAPGGDTTNQLPPAAEPANPPPAGPDDTRPDHRESDADGAVADSAPDTGTNADADADGGDITGPAVAASLLGLAALGLLTTVTRRRRIASRRRPQGVRAAQPTAEMRDLEAQLRQQARAAEDTVATLELALLLASDHAPAAQLRALWQHPDGSFELILTGVEGQPPPAPFTATDRGWLLPARNVRFLYTVKQDRTDTAGSPSQMNSEEHARRPAPFPLLMPVGSRNGSTCLVNIERLGLISLITDRTDDDPGAPPGRPAATVPSHDEPTDRAADRGPASGGPAVRALSLMAAWVQALSSAPWADLVRIDVPQCLAPFTTGLDRLTVLDVDSDAARYAQAELSPDEQDIVDRYDSLAHARRTDQNLNAIVLSLWVGYTAKQLPDKLLRNATDPRNPNTVLLLGPHPDADTWHLNATGLLTIPGVARNLEPMALTAEHQQLVLRLLEHAEDPPQADADAPDRTELLGDCPPLTLEPAGREPDDPAAQSAAARPVESGPVLNAALDNSPPVLSLRPPDDTATASSHTSAIADDTGPATVENKDPDQDQDQDNQPDVQDGSSAPSAELPQALVVNILGPLQILGAHGDPPRRHCLEMLVYLTLHRRPVPVQSLWQAVFPDRPYDGHQLVNRMSELRRYARQKLPQIKRTYQVDELTISDWQRFRALSDGNPAQQLEALALVRGRPFEDLRADWIHLEGQLAEIEASIVDLALQVGERALRQRDPDTARTAALAGLRGCPWDERLYRIAMQAAAARGATHEIHQLRRQLQLVLDDELDGDDDIQPATEQLYSTLRQAEDRQRSLAERRRNGG
jgi:hypothetical protein